VVASAEETLYRGFLQDMLSAWLGCWWAYLATALAFTALHLPARLLGGEPLAQALTYATVQLLPMALLFGGASWWPGTRPRPRSCTWPGTGPACCGVGDAEWVAWRNWLGFDSAHGPAYNQCEAAGGSRPNALGRARQSRLCYSWGSNRERLAR